MLLGAGRARIDASIDSSAGVTILKKPGAEVEPGEDVLLLHYNDESRVAEAARVALSAIEIGSAPRPPVPLVLGWVHAEGEMSYV
jgi:pyrimidine-nucleoside phosphorylase